MAEASLVDVPPCARLLLHCDPADRAAFADALVLDLPDAMLRAGEARGWHALHLSPDEWLLIGPPGEAREMTAVIARTAAGTARSLVDISERNLAVTLSGTAAADVLNAGCALDLSPHAFPPGSCTRTLFGKADILLWRPGDALAFRLEYARSFADYVRRFLAEAMLDA